MAVSPDRFQKELDYHMTLILAKEMLARGVISPDDFVRIDKLCTERYRPMFSRAEPDEARHET